MRLAIASTATLLGAWLLAASAGLAATPGHLQYVGTVTGNPEQDSYGYVGQAMPQQVLCIVGPARYVGEVTGDPEKDTYGYPTKLVTGSACPSIVVGSK